MAVFSNPIRMGRWSKWEIEMGVKCKYNHTHSTGALLHWGMSSMGETSARAPHGH